MMIKFDIGGEKIFISLFLYFFTEPKIKHLSYFIFKNDSIVITDPRGMQNVCHT